MWVVVLVLLAAGPDFDDIVAGVGERNHDQTIALMEQWVDAHKPDPRAGRGLLWMAQLRLADGRPDLARPLLERTNRDYPGTEWQLHAMKQLADLDVERHHYGAAIATYDKLAAMADPYWKYLGEQAGIYARGERSRFEVFLALGAVLLAAVVAQLVVGRKAAWPPPEEVLYVAPVLAVVLIATFFLAADAASAVRIVIVGGIACLWAQGAFLKARPPRAPMRVARMVLGLAQGVVLVYGGIVVNHLWLKLMLTLQGNAGE